MNIRRNSAVLLTFLIKFMSILTTFLSIFAMICCNCCLFAELFGPSFFLPEFMLNFSKLRFFSSNLL